MKHLGCNFARLIGSFGGLIFFLATNYRKMCLILMIAFLLIKEKAVLT